LNLSHYFTNNNELEHDIRTLELSLQGTNLTLITDRGVFSNKEIDEGSTVLLKSIIKSIDVKGEVLDVGCGYGTLGLYLAARYPEIKVTMFDINERAVSLTSENAKRNNLTNTHVYVDSDYQALPKHTFNLIVINPPIHAGKKAYYPLLSAARDYLTDGGILMFVIRKSHGAKSAAKYLSDYYSNITLIQKDAGFYVYHAQK
jgi:16S rRNA (guanine1207-N2)-methyltransferase